MRYTSNCHDNFRSLSSTCSSTKSIPVFWLCANWNKSKILGVVVAHPTALCLMLLLLGNACYEQTIFADVLALSSGLQQISQPSGYFADLIPRLSEKTGHVSNGKNFKQFPLAGFVQPLSLTCPLTFLAVGSLFTIAPFCCLSWRVLKDCLLVVPRR